MLKETANINIVFIQNIFSQKRSFQQKKKTIIIEAGLYVGVTDTDKIVISKLLSYSMTIFKSWQWKIIGMILVLQKTDLQ